VAKINKPFIGDFKENTFTHFLVDMSVWIDEFLYQLFDYLE